MEVRNYVNEAADRRRMEGARETSPPVRSKLLQLVGVSFGLLCIIQSALNIYFLQQQVGLSKVCNVSACNVTLLSEDYMRAMILKEEKHLKEIHQLVQEKNQLFAKNKELEQDKVKQSQENIQLNGEKDKLVQEKNQQLQENKVIKEDQSKLYQENSLLGKNKELEDQLSKLQTAVTNTPTCPTGWHSFRSSCYQLSSEAKTWRHAKQSCENQGAHLVIVNDETEQRFVVYFGGANNIWIGLYIISHPFWMRTLTWVDGSSLSYSPNFHLSTGTRDYKECVHIKSSLPCANNWSLGNCNQGYHWICEKKTH